MADIVTIGLAYDTSALTAGSRQVQTAMQQLTQAEKQAETASEQLARSSTKTAQALGQEQQAASRTSQSTQQAAQSTRTLAQHEQALAQALAQNSQALATNTQAMQRAGQAKATMGQQARGAQGIIGELTQSFGALAASAIALRTLMGGVGSVIQEALKLDQLRLALGAVTGSVRGAAEAEAFARAEADRLGLSQNVLIEGYGKILVATKGTILEGQRSRDMYQNLNETMRALGLSTEDQRGVMRAWNQMLQQGAIQGDELRNELGSRIPVMQYLVEATNGAAKSQAEVNKMMEEGKLKNEASASTLYNLSIILQRELGQKGGAAAQSTAAALQRFDNAVQDLKVALGQGLLPALAESARALTAFLNLGKDSASAYSSQFIPVMREATSVLIGMSGAVLVTGKYLAAMAAGIAFGPEAWSAGWEDVKQTFSDVVDLQNKVLKGGFAAPPAQAQAKRSQEALPVVPGGAADGDKKGRGRTEEDKAGAKAAQERLSLQQQLNDAYEKELHTERELTDLHLQRAGFTAEQRTALMLKYDDTQLLKEDNKLREDRLALDKTLQEALDKQVYSERELLQRKMEGLRYGEEEIKIRLKQFDTEKRIRKEKEKQAEAEREAIQATREHENTVERLMAKLEPRRRRMSRREQLQEAYGELATETSDPYLLAKADIKIKETLDTEAWQTWRDFAEESLDRVGDAITQFAFHGKLTFKEMTTAIAEDFFRMSLKMVTESAFSGATGAGSGGSGGQGWLQVAFNAGLKLLGAAAKTGGGSPGLTGGDAPGMQHGGSVYAGQPYVVGENGPELLVPRMNGTILPNGQGIGGTTVINVNVHGVQDVQSFHASRGSVQRGIAGAVNQAYRGL
jgi:tape measure domain-containing protein